MSAKPNAGGEDFEIVDPTKIEFVRRGRKTNLDPKVLNAVKGLAKGQTLAIRMLAVDPASPDFRNEKAKVSAQIRKACENAGHKKHRINWTAQGVPCVTV
jgi:hypothetical protein